MIEDSHGIISETIYFLFAPKYHEITFYMSAQLHVWVW